ncbi:MAG: DeoR/GlpR family DNA-binding transcription regulator [Lachnospiraceae bacterium]|nr:DeoR/GlpR family DNA-binding transcription regulator [Lachnospiraceae bacterium]
MAMKSYRISRMEQYIIDKEHVSMDELCREFDISINTCRMDVAELCSKGTVKKVYGGVSSVKENSLIPFEQRKMTNSNIKKEICREAAEMVEDGDIIFIDSGSTTMYLPDFLGDKKNVTIITHNLNAIVRGIQLPDTQIFCLPGTLDRRTNSFVTADTAKTLSRFNIKKAFIASAGISENGDVSNSSPLEFEVKKAAMAHASKKYLVVDSSKFGKSSLLNFTTLAEMDGIFTDDAIDRKTVLYCEQNKVHLYTACRGK